MRESSHGAQKDQRFNPGPRFAPECDRVLPFVNHGIIDDIAVGLIDGKIAAPSATA